MATGWRPPFANQTLRDPVLSNYFTASEAALLTPAPVAVTESVNAALLALYYSVMVRFADPEPAMVPEDATVTPAGIPVALTVTGEVKPGVPTTLTVILPVAPGNTVVEVGLRDMENVGTMVNASVADW